MPLARKVQPDNEPQIPQRRYTKPPATLVPEAGAKNLRPARRVSPPASGLGLEAWLETWEQTIRPAKCIPLTATLGSGGGVIMTRKRYKAIKFPCLGAESAAFYPPLSAVKSAVPPGSDLTHCANVRDNATFNIAATKSLVARWRSEIAAVAFSRIRRDARRTRCFDAHLAWTARTVLPEGGIGR
jgi:hypothetical protein